MAARPGGESAMHTQACNHMEWSENKMGTTRGDQKTKVNHT